MPHPFNHHRDTHPAAKAWDDSHGYAGPSKDRPCDRCGEPIGEVGFYIHKHCMQEELAEHGIGVVPSPRDQP